VDLAVLEVVLELVVAELEEELAELALAMERELETASVSVPEALDCRNLRCSGRQ
jgi:hypothetical protein